jgi:hypothetical protein
MLDCEMDTDPFFKSFSLTDCQELRTGGDRFIAKRKLDFESALSFDKKSLILRQDANSHSTAENSGQ